MLKIMMARKTASPKVIADPVYGIVDIRPVLAMVETEEFQALGDKRQLGMSHLTFPSATHTRKAHSLGAYHATRELADRWIKRGAITEREGKAMAGYALYHDIGHPAFSHVTEPLCPVPKGAGGSMSVNSALSLMIIRRRRREIEAAGIDFKLLEGIACHRNPLHLAVSDKNLGMEKLDYLERDGLFTILSRPVGVEYLRHHIYFADGRLAIDEKVVDNAIEIQNFYLKMYKNVYLRKTSAIAQRMLQKMTHRLIVAGDIAASDLPGMTDSELLGSVRFSGDPAAHAMYHLFKTRDLYREGIVVRPERFAGNEARPGKAVFTFAANHRDIHKLIRDPALQPKNQEGLAAIEDAIGAIAGIPKNNILAVPIITPERFEAQDIMIYRGKGRKPASLKERYPAHFKNIEEVAQAYPAFRVATTGRYRAKLSSPRIAKKVLALLLK